MSLVTLAPNPSFTSALKYIILQHTGATPFTPSLLLAPKSSQYGHSTALHHLCHNLLDQPQTQDSRFGRRRVSASDPPAAVPSH